MTRPTPFDLALGSLTAELDGLREAAARTGRDLHYREEFERSPEVQRLLARFQAPDLVAAHPEAAASYLALLYAAYRFREAGARLLAPSRARLEPALEGPPPRNPPSIPGGACYLQLPASWVWARSGDGGPHEPLDGCFLAADARGDEIVVIAVLGLRAERGGFTQVTLHASPADFVAAAEERRDPPFGPLMDGGGAAGVRSVATAGELLLLMSLALAVSGQ